MYGSEKYSLSQVSKDTKYIYKINIRALKKYIVSSPNTNLLLSKQDTAKNS